MATNPLELDFTFLGFLPNIAELVPDTESENGNFYKFYV